LFFIPSGREQLLGAGFNHGFLSYAKRVVKLREPEIVKYYFFEMETKVLSGKNSIINGLENQYLEIRSKINRFSRGKAV